VFWQADSWFDDGQANQSTVEGVTQRKKYDTGGRLKNIHAFTGATFYSSQRIALINKAISSAVLTSQLG
jgi:hypothetical protein